MAAPSRNASLRISTQVGARLCAPFRTVVNAASREPSGAYALLNRYWELDFMLEAADPDGRCATFDDLERALFR